MNIANVTERFTKLSGLEKSEVYNWKSVIDEAVRFVGSRLRKQELDLSDMLRVETLCAVYAYRLYTLCSDDGISSFTAGDVKLTSSADAVKKAERLWNEYKFLCSDLVNADEFLFGAIEV